MMNFINRLIRLIKLKFFSEEQFNREFFKEKLNKKNILNIGLILFLFFVLLTKFFSSDESQEKIEKILPKVDLTDVLEYQSNNAVINAVGKVESMNQVNLSSQISAEIKRINIKIGDSVKKGDLLVELDHASLDAQLHQSAASINRAKGLLDQRIAGASEEDRNKSKKSIAQVEAALNQAEANLEQVEAQSQKSINDAESALELAKSSLENNKNITKQNIVDSYDNLRVYLNDFLASIHTAITAIGNILGEEPGDSSADDAFEDVFSVKDESKKYEAENFFNSLKLSYEEIRDVYNSLSVSSSQKSVERVANLFMETLNLTEASLNSIRKALDNTMTRDSFTESTLNTLKTGIDTQISYISADKTTLESLMQATVNSKLSDVNTNDANKINYEKAVKDLEQIKKQAAANIKVAQSNVEIQRASLAQIQAAHESVIAGPREVDLSSLRSSVSEAQASFNLIKSNYEKAFIRAPFDGVISSVFFDEHDLVGSGQVLVSLVNVKGLEVKAYISEKDRQLIKKDASVEIEGGYLGNVLRISPSLDINTKKIEIIILVQEEDTKLTVGQFVNLKIKIDEDIATDNVFYLPLKSVKVDSDSAYVFLVDDENKIYTKKVELGEVVDDKIEVKNLDQNDQIIINIRGLKENDLVDINK